MRTTMTHRTFDLVVFGATGFTGGLVVEALASAPELKQGFKVALAGRNRDKLNERAAALRAKGAAVDVVVVDATDARGLAALAQKTTAVLTTVGPYLRYGMPLDRAAAEAGTHLIDLTGEPPFVRASIDAHHALAVHSGARIVHCGGFDSVPSDLGTLLLQESALADGGACDDVTLTMMRMRGGFSGGTAQSLLAVVEAASKDKILRRAMSNPYALVPEGNVGPDQRDDFSVRVLDDGRDVVGPFFMAAINTRVVRRTNYLLGYRYGHDFRYREQQRFGRGLLARATAHAVQGGLAVVVGLAATAPGRAVLQTILPAPGTGPSPELRHSGYFEARLDGIRAHDGARYRARVSAHKDPGYGATADMIVEGALQLATAQDLGAPGVTTPAAALGLPYVERLRRRGMVFSVEKVAS
jgi:short subunit dehydrogenase-like uncharacterized protein